MFSEGLIVDLYSGFVDRWVCFISFSSSIMLYSRHVSSVMMYGSIGICRFMDAGLGALSWVSESPGPSTLPFS